MSPGRRRDFTPFVLVLGSGAIVLFLVVGGLASVGRSSGAYHASIEGSFGAQAKVVVSQSNSVGSELERLVAQMPSLDRSALSLRLDEVATGAEAVAASAGDLSGPIGRSGAEFVQSMSGRAQAVTTLRKVVDGLLSITPGNGGTGTPSPFPPSPVSVSGATQAITALGHQLVTADGAYRSARAEFAKVPGGSLLPVSVWVPHPVLWGAGAVQTMVNQISSSPSLAPRVDVQLLAVALSPPVLPPVPAVKGQPQAPPLVNGAVQIPPTCTVVVTAVVGNEGSVVVTKVPVQASVQPISGGPAFVVKRAVTLAPSGSVALTLPVLAVLPSTTYALTVTLEPPAGQSGPVGTQTATIAVASLGSSKRNSSSCAHTPAAAP